MYVGPRLLFPPASNISLALPRRLTPPVELKRTLRLALGPSKKHSTTAKPFVPP